MRVLVVDDHAVFRKGVRQVLVETFTEAHVGEAATQQEALALADREPWDIVLLDLSLRGRDGIELLRELKRRWPQMPVLVVSMEDEREYAVRVLRAGAAGYVAKTAAADELPTAIRTALSGGTHVNSAVGAELAAAVAGKRTEAPHAALSDRELQVLRMIGAGKSVKQIAAELALSEKTISTYRTRLLDKLVLENTAELIRYAIERGLA
jgi:DNA-binding NarL/FixJ family response regulator